ncbi:hypothetical protein [Azospirillum doebereinerae]
MFAHGSRTLPARSAPLSSETVFQRTCRRRCPKGKDVTKRFNLH